MFFHHSTRALYDTYEIRIGVRHCRNDMPGPSFTSEPTSSHERVGQEICTASPTVIALENSLHESSTLDSEKKNLCRAHAI